MSYVYIESESWTDDNGQHHKLLTVGFYKPDGKFEAESDHEDTRLAAARVHYLNGGGLTAWHKPVDTPK